jgi:hypothetical protein
VSPSLKLQARLNWIVIHAQAQTTDLLLGRRHKPQLLVYITRNVLQNESKRHRQEYETIIILHCETWVADVALSVLGNHGEQIARWRAVIMIQLETRVDKPQIIRYICGQYMYIRWNGRWEDSWVMTNNQCGIMAEQSDWWIMHCLGYFCKSICANKYIIIGDSQGGGGHLVSKLVPSWENVFKN